MDTTSTWVNVPLEELGLEHFDGCVSLQRGPGWIRPWRLHHETVLSGVVPSSLASQMSSPSGVVLRVRTAAAGLRLTCTRVHGLDPDILAMPDTSLFDRLVKSSYMVTSPLRYDCYVDDDAGAATVAASQEDGLPLLPAPLLQATNKARAQYQLPQVDPSQMSTEQRARARAFLGLEGEFSDEALGQAKSRTHTVMLAPFPSMGAGAGSAAGTNGRVVTVWLPHSCSVRIEKVEALLPAAMAVPPRVLPVVDPRPRWVTYGSSITHCVEAASPSTTWPAIAARLADVRLLSLGVGGQCHMDQVVARLIRDTAADCISLKLGINVHNFTSLGARSFASAAFGFVATVRDGHPTTPLVVISPIASPARERGPVTVQDPPMTVGTDADAADGAAAVRRVNGNAKFLGLREMRSELERVVATLRAAGDARVFYRSGLEIFDEANDAPTMPDGLHPDAKGYERMGRRFAALEFGPEGRLLAGRVRVGPKTRL